MRRYDGTCRVMVVEKVIIVSVHVRYFSFFRFFSLCQTGYIRLRRLHQVTSGYVSLRQRDGTWSSTILKFPWEYELQKYS